MGSFSTKKRDQQVTNALKPYSFSSPYGNVSVAGKGINFKPALSEPQKQMETETDKRLLETLQAIPRGFSIEDSYNSPFAKDMEMMGRRELDRQRGDDSRELQNFLSARNQLGSSYDAMRQRDLDDRYDKLYADNDARAKQFGFAAYNQNYGNLLDTLTRLRADRAQGVNTTFTPLQAAMGYQQSLSPLQGAQANYFGQRKSAGQQVLDFILGAGQVGAQFYGAGG